MRGLHRRGLGDDWASCPDVPVVVVGAGPVGLTAALLLARRGRRGARAGAPPRALSACPRAVHLDDEVFRVLQAAGVADDVAGDHAARWPGCACSTAAARARRVPPATGRAAATAGRRARCSHQPDLEAVLRRGRRPARRRSRWTPGWRWSASTQDDDGGRRRPCADGATGRTGPSARSFVLGCDGANSTVRAADRRPDARPGAGRPVAGARRAVARCRCRSGPGCTRSCDPRRAATFMPVTGEPLPLGVPAAPGGDGRPS